MEENKNETEVVKKESYLKRDTLEVLTDSNEISYYKNLQYEEIVNSNLLGSFDGAGNYTISKDISLELISAKKYIREEKDNKYVLSVPIKEGFDNLLLTLKIEEENDKKIATLKIIENNLKADGSSEFIKTVIVRYKDDNDIYFMIKVKKAFNIVDEESEGKEINNEEFLKLVIKKLQDFKSLKGKNSIFEEISREYIEKLIEILNNNPCKYSEFILRHYEVFLSEMKEMVGKPNYYKILKNKLDKIVNETNKRVSEPVIKALIDSARKELINKQDKIKEDVLNPKPVVAKAKPKEEAKPKKEEESKKVSKKPAKKIEAKKAEAKKAGKKKVQLPPPINKGNEEKKKETKEPEKNPKEIKDKVDNTLAIGESITFQDMMLVQSLKKESSVLQEDAISDTLAPIYKKEINISKIDKDTMYK